MAKGTRVLNERKRVRLTADARMPFIIAYAVLFAFFAICIYIIRTTPPPPSGEPVRVAMWEGVGARAEDFVINVTGVNVSIDFEPFEPGLHSPGASDVVIILEDSYGRVTLVTSELYIYHLMSSYVVAIDDDVSSLTVTDFISGNIQDVDVKNFQMITDLNGIDTGSIGTHEIIIHLNGIAPLNNTIIKVIDVEPPQGIPVNREHWTVDDFEPEDFVTDIIDQTEVIVSYINEPDRTKIGQQEVHILLTDEFGNTSIVTSILTLKKDTEPPKIEGIFDKTACIGEAVLYRKGITVTDNRDEYVPLVVDSSAVDMNTVGTYPVIYSATDLSGNTTTVNGTLRIYDVSYEEVEEMIAEIADSLIKGEMTDEERARAVYDYVRSRITYGTGSIYDNLHYAVFRALKSGSGDCYAYYSLSELLLNAVGVENLPIKRVAGYPTRHFWNLIYIDEVWYHFDTAPNFVTGGFKFTDSRAAEVTVLAAERVPGYYVYDKALYPAIAP